MIKKFNQLHQFMQQIPYRPTEKMQTHEGRENPSLSCQSFSAIYPLLQTGNGLWSFSVFCNKNKLSLTYLKAGLTPNTENSA